MADTKKSEPEEVRGADFMPVEQLPAEPERADKPKPEGPALDTPSGHALKTVGMPDEDDPRSEKEQKRGVRYGAEKFKKRWLS